MKASDRTVEEWFPKIALGQVHLPRFQRFEADGHPEGIDRGVLRIFDVKQASPRRVRPVVAATMSLSEATDVIVERARAEVKEEWGPAEYE